MNTLHLSHGPHIRDRWTTSFIMHTVLIALLPTAIVGVIVNGWHALFVILGRSYLRSGPSGCSARSRGASSAFLTALRRLRA